MASSSDAARGQRGFIPPQNDSERFLMRRVEELCRTAENRGIARSTGFLSDREQALAAQAIAAGKVEVNHLPLRTAHEPVYEGDLFTVRGQGRWRLQAVGGKSRKDRIFITFFQY